MATNFTSYESFLRTATGGERDALNTFNRLDDLCPAELLGCVDDARLGAELSAKLNAGFAGMTEAEILAENLHGVERAIEYARDDESA